MTDQAAVDRLRSIHGIGPKRSQHILKVLEEQSLTWNEMLAMPADRIKILFGLPINIAQALASSQPDSSSQAGKSVEVPDELAQKAIRWLTRDHPEYPDRLKLALGSDAPKNLYIWGNLELLNRPAIGFCGSRRASDKGINVTRDVAQQVAGLGWVVVSGHAAGIDTAAHKAAIEAGSGTIIVAPQGILDLKLRRELKQLAKPDQLLIISEFPPKAGWNVGYAMQRNRTIIALSDAMVLIEAREEGGTFEAGKQALKLRKPLFVAHYGDMTETRAGNQYFLERGARSLLKSPSTGRANIDQLRQLVQAAHQPESGLEKVLEPEQMSLFDQQTPPDIQDEAIHALVHSLDVAPQKRDGSRRSQDG
jgi:DNA processing protein